MNIYVIYMYVKDEIVFYLTASFTSQWTIVVRLTLSRSQHSNETNVDRLFFIRA